MARLYTVCGETQGFGDSGASAEAVIQSYSTHTYSTAQARSGAYAHALDSSTVPNTPLIFQDFTGTSGATYFLRGWLYITTWPDTDFLAAVFYAAGAVSLCQARLTTTGTIGLYVGGSLVGSTQQLSLNTWTCIELSIKINSASGSDDDAALRINGTTLASVTNTAIDTALPIQYQLGWVEAVSGAANNALIGNNKLMYADDIALNDSTGTVQNSWPGIDGKCLVVRVSGAGDTAPSTGTVASVDEMPPSSADIITLTATATTGYFTLLQSDYAVVGASDSILFVAVNAMVSGATGTACNWIARIKSQASGTVASGGNKAIASTTYHGNATASANRTHGLVQYTDPQAGGPWTKALLDTAQIGFGSGDVSPNPRASAVWAVIEYVPAAAGVSGIVVLQAGQRQLNQLLGR